MNRPTRKGAHRLTAVAVSASALLASAGLPAHAARPGPSISITNVSVTEGNSGQNQMLFALQVKGAWNKNMKVDYQTVDGSAVQSSDYDYKQGTVSFAGGKRQRVAVWANGDSVQENNETFTVALSNSVGGAVIKPGGGLGTITNDDQLPDLSVDDVIVGEGDTGTTPATFKFTLSNASTADVSFDYATADGSATAPVDYTASAGTLTFAPGQLTKTVAVPVVSDMTNESDENFSVNLSGASGVALPAASPTVTIIDDESAPAVSVSDATVTEGDSGTVSASFDVVLSHAAGTAATVAYATSDGSATAPADYQSAAGTINFAAGDLTETVAVQVEGDHWNEKNEDFALILSACLLYTSPSPRDRS